MAHIGGCSHSLPGRQPSWLSMFASCVPDGLVRKMAVWGPWHRVIYLSHYNITTIRYICSRYILCTLYLWNLISRYYLASGSYIHQVLTTVLQLPTTGKLSHEYGIYRTGGNFETPTQRATNNNMYIVYTCTCNLLLCCLTLFDVSYHVHTYMYMYMYVHLLD